MTHMDNTVIKVVKNSVFSGDPGPSRAYMVGMDGYVRRVYGEPPELLANCRCGALTVVDGEIIGKVFYGTRRRVYVWCTGHQPWWWRARMLYIQWRWRLFGRGTPLHREPDMNPT
jgi:hypothetical protein